MTDRKKILMLSWEYPPNVVGGLSRHVEGLAKALSMIGYQIHIITTWIKDLPTYERVGNIEIFRVVPLNDGDSSFIRWVGGLNLSITHQAIALIQEHEYALIHAHDWLVGAAAVTLKEEYHLPLVTTIHATEYGRNEGIFTEMQKKIHEQEKALVGYSDKVIICSPSMKEEVIQVFGLETQKIVMLPNGIDTSIANITYSKEVIERFPIQPEKKMVFSIGRMVKEKGFHTLIETAKEMEKSRKDVYFIIAGKGPMLREFRHRVEHLGLEHIHFIGYVSDIEREALFKQCYLAVFPSLYEPFGIVALESMTYSKPTIVSNVGGLKGIVDHLHTGLIMESNHSNSLLEQATTLLDNEELAARLGMNGRKTVETLYSWNRIAEDTKRVYEETELQMKL
jgi:glycosyltransferase involved in cell wall biosynthesis